MANLILGSFTLVKSEGFDEFMKALGVGMVMRKMGNSATPTVTFTEAGGEYTMKTVTTFKTSEVKFKLDTPMKETTMDGREAESTFTLEGSTLTQIQKASKGPDVKYIREFSEKELTTTCEAGGVKSLRVYKRN
ncbi:Lipocalin/cytosolic fatty-acid binding domain [Trinorchestia longiramus]|nr:Lipocalin/cytosolic fatty-acid binding domain [Trinorchestia longiramus]